MKEVAVTHPFFFYRNTENADKLFLKEWPGNICSHADTKTTKVDFPCNVYALFGLFSWLYQIFLYMYWLFKQARITTSYVYDSTHTQTRHN